MARDRIHVPVDQHGRPGDLSIATALALLLTAAVAEDWTTNHDAEWAAMEGLARIAGALGFAYTQRTSDDAMFVERSTPAAAGT